MLLQMESEFDEIKSLNNVYSLVSQMDSMLVTH